MIINPLTPVECYNKPLWTIEQGLELARKWEKILAPKGIHVALGGSVLREGKSTKDVDIFVYPHKAQMDARHILAEVIPLLDGDPIDASEYHDDDAKVVYCGYVNKKRVDIFIVQ